MTRRRVGVEERRHRLARRHALAPGHDASNALTAASRLVALHGTDPGTVYLSVRARVAGFTTEDLDDAIYRSRTLTKHLAMRRTLWVVPTASLPEIQAGASNRVAGQQRRRLVKQVEEAGLHRDGSAWLDRAGAEVLSELESQGEATSTELRAARPILDGSFTYGEGKAWGGEVPIGPQVLTVLSAEGHIVRASNDGAWTVSRPRWATTPQWVGHEIEQLDEDDGVAALVGAWLRAFGPGTEVDIKWWLGSTLTLVRRALDRLDAVEVDLDGETGYLLPDDLEPEPPAESWTALLPALDPTTMGWFERDWYLGDHREQLFDRNGNAGPSAWCNGRIVGGWRQVDDGSVQLQLLEDIDGSAEAALQHSADELATWLDGARVPPRFPSPLSKR